MIQSAGNASGQVARNEHELQVLRKRWIAYKREASLSHGNVQYARVKKHVAKSKPPCMSSLPSMYQYVLKYAGGTDALFLIESESFIKSQSSSATTLTPEVWEALSLEYKGVNQAIRFRHGLLKLLFVSNNTMKVSSSDIRKCGSKEFLPKVMAANDLMVEARTFLGANGLDTLESAGRLGWFDIHVVAFTLGKHKATNIHAIAHQMVEDLKTQLKKTDLESPWAHTVEPAEDSVPKPPAVPGLGLREFTADAKLQDPCRILIEKGFAVGMSVMRKEDKAIGCIQSLSGATVKVRTSTNTCEVPVELFLQAAWTKHEPKTDDPEEIKSWHLHAPHQSTDFVVNRAKAALTVELFELSKKHPAPNELKLYNKPKYVISDRKFDKSKLVLVPATTRIGIFTDGKLQVGSFCVGSFEKVLFSISPQITLPGSKASPFIAPFWFLAFSSNTEDVNMEIGWHRFQLDDQCQFWIPFAKNCKPIKAGDRLVMHELTDEDKGLSSHLVGGDEKPGKVRKAASASGHAKKVKGSHP